MSKGRTKGLLAGRRRRDHWHRRRRYTGALQSEAGRANHVEMEDRGRVRAAQILARWRAGDE